MMPPWSDSISFSSFIASMMHSVSPAADALADFDEGFGARVGRAVEGADHRRFDDVAFGRCRRNGLGGDHRCDRRGRGVLRRVIRHAAHIHRLAVLLGPGNADFFFALGDFKLGNAGFFHQVDQFFQFSQIHNSGLDGKLSTARSPAPVGNPARPAR